MHLAQFIHGYHNRGQVENLGQSLTAEEGLRFRLELIFRYVIKTLWYHNLAGSN